MASSSPRVLLIGLLAATLSGCGGAPAVPAARLADEVGAAARASELDELIVASREATPPAIAGARPKARFAFMGTHYHLLALSGAAGKEGLLDALARRPGVERVGLNRRWRSLEAQPPDDEFYALQYGVVQKKLPEAWARARGKGVTVAVVDTGVDMRHPDLAGRVDPGPDLINGDGDPSDDRGHGTHVAGIIGAATNNAQGIAGVAPECRLLAVKVLGANGQGDAYTAARGIVEAIAKGAKVVNLSLGGPAIDSALRGFYADVVKSGTLLVAASGNDGEAVGFPAALPGVLSVGASDEAGQLAAFSNRGANMGLTAPGVGVLSTFPGKLYVQRSGTSMAAPFVAGVAALLWSKQPALQAAEVRARLLATAADRGSPGVDPVWGHGEVDPLAALAD